MKKAIVIVCGICVSAACVCMACQCGAPGGPEVFNNDTLSEFHAVHGNPTCMCQCNRYHKFGVYSNECKNVCRICNGDKNGNNRGADSIHDYPDDAEYCGCPVHGAAMANVNVDGVNGCACIDFRKRIECNADVEGNAASDTPKTVKCPCGKHDEKGTVRNGK